MTVFGTYSKYYDLLYEDKDYVEEASYLDRLIRQYNPHGKSVLDLGCGTGKHATLLAKMGYDVVGVDKSQDMLNEAMENLHPDLRLSFVHGDVCDVRLGRKFDVVISIFHVMSYQTSNAELQIAFATAATHLHAGGIFIFDCWYGPAVLMTRPEVRVKKLENETITMMRIAEPVMCVNENVVDVNYHIFIRDKSTNQVEELFERHKMRYLFNPEVLILFERAGLKAISFFEYMTGAPPSDKTWSVCFITARKNEK